MGPSDAELIARVLARDDRHAYATLVRRYQSQVRSLLRRLTCGDGELADDIAQETFLAAYRGLPRYRGQGRFSSWLYRIAYHAWVDATRAGRRVEAAPLEAPDETGSSGTDAEPSASQAEVARVEARHDLERAMHVLRDAERAALALTYAADATHEEAAVILACPVGTVKSYVMAAKIKLRAALEGQSPPQAW